MIGILVGDAQRSIVSEFFELFKTPWEFYRDRTNYDVLICSKNEPPDSSARLVLIYGDDQQAFDRQLRIETSSARSDRLVVYKGDRIPIYSNCLAFKMAGIGCLMDQSTEEPVAVEIGSSRQTVVRIGFDLFEELRHLLDRGQPSRYAQTPTLELHIALLRELILTHSIPLIEIPPVPAGHNFIACLTHDVDHAGIRHHKFDHTMFGFLYRATIGSLINFCRGRRSFRELAANWMAAFSIPLVYMGLAKDFWSRFDRYVEFEKGIGSTFFIVPSKGNPGQQVSGRPSFKRATRYDVTDVQDQIKGLTSANCEIGCHGIDAWHDATKGRQELGAIRRATNCQNVGVRSHWLYFDRKSPAIMEAAGFSYDSSSGYNETVGYRAGTTQVFKPLETDQLLELPMHIMDTALFYPAHLNLSPNQARRLVSTLIDNSTRFGGVLTVNWHDRSIAPERLWDKPYNQLLKDLKSRDAWFATAAKTIAWFKQRRSVRIDNVTRDGDKIRARVTMNAIASDLPSMIVRCHQSPSKHIDIPVTHSTEVEFPSI